jgi:hypothetical protein
MSASSRRIRDGPPRPAAPKSGRCNDRPYHQRGWSGHHSCTSGADTATLRRTKTQDNRMSFGHQGSLRRSRDFARRRWPFGQHKMAVCRVAPTAAPRIPSRQSADGCALWSRLETRYLRLPSPLRHNIFRQTQAPFGPHSDEDLRWRPGAPQACHFASVITNKLSEVDPQAARGEVCSGPLLLATAQGPFRRVPSFRQVPSARPVPFDRPNNRDASRGDRHSGHRRTSRGRTRRRRPPRRRRRRRPRWLPTPRPG